MLLSLVLGLGLTAMEPPESAEVCGRCHRAIHDAWVTSAHAKAMESRVFQDALDQAETHLGAEARKICLPCHSPVGVRLGDFSLRRKVSWEGVTCEYCHSVQEVSFTGPNPVAKVQFSLVKSGPLKDSESTGHGTVFSEVHTTSAICAPCHEYRNALGFPVLTTYTEWKNSRAYKEGKQCQSCHMYKVAGKVVDPRVKRSQDALVNLHQMPGSHSIEQLNKTIAATMTTTRENGQLKVTVEVANRAAGHSVPTGSPLRQLVLDVAADSYDGQHYKGERIYRRVVADAKGTELTTADLSIVRSAKVLSDTRLAADEKRAEVFQFPVPAGVQAQVKATLWYQSIPLGTDSPPRVTFLTLQRLVK